MRLKSYIKHSFIDYPDRAACVIFTAGCNFRCPYCHNPGFIEDKPPYIAESEIFDYLNLRKKWLDAVVICGGEPLFHSYSELEKFILKIKEIKDFSVKLDTNGSSPKTLQKLIFSNLIHFVSMDIKAPFDKYNEVCGVNVNTENIKESIAILKEFKKAEFRTTYAADILDEKDILKIKKIIFPFKLKIQKLNTENTYKKMPMPQKFYDEKFSEIKP